MAAVALDLLDLTARLFVCLEMLLGLLLDCVDLFQLRVRRSRLVSGNHLDLFSPR